MNQNPEMKEPSRRANVDFFNGTNTWDGEYVKVWDIKVSG